MLITLLALTALANPGPLGPQPDLAQDAIFFTSGLAWAPAAQGASPMSLTAADGTGLVLREMNVSAVVDDPLEFTELHLVFDNPEDRQIEGRFEITLPPGAAVSRFAMKLGDHWQEGEVVELQAARRAYEDFLHQRTDPALLEYDAGNTFRARVFPIEAKGSKELIISWSRDLDADEPWSLPTGGLPQLGKLDARVSMGGETYTMTAEHAVPEGDLSLPIERTTTGLAMRGGDFSAIRVVPELTVGADPLDDVTILFDTSASRALSLSQDLATLAQVVATFPGRAKVRVLAFDQEVFEVYDGRASGFGPGELAILEARQAMGASDLSAALTAVQGAERVLVLTDGVATAGDTERGALLDAVRFTRADRLDVIVSGGARDEASVESLVTAGLKDFGVVLDADRIDAAEIGRRLALGASGEMAVSVPGAEWVWPTTVSGLQPGDSVTIWAELADQQPLSLSLGDRPVTGITEAPANGPLLQRAAAQAEIGRLYHLEGMAQTAEQREALAASIVDLSTRFRVLSPHTGLLVLETEADYARFDIPRDALADILTIRDGQLQHIARKEPVFIDNPSTLQVPEDDSRDAEEPASDVDKKMKSAESEHLDGMAADPMDGPVPAPQAMAQDVTVEFARSRPPRERRMMEAEEEDEEPMPSKPAKLDPLDAWEGPYREVMQHLLAGRLTKAEARARAWRAESPADPLALLALGAVLEERGQLQEAARVYGSLIDLFPSRADLRRLAGERLQTLGEAGLPLATDSYTKALLQRDDHPAGHRLLAWTHARQGNHPQAIEVLRKALDQPFDRFASAHRILREDAALIAAAWAADGGGSQVGEALQGMDVQPADKPELRFILNWETDNNDVDFHIYDGKGGHAYYSSPSLDSGGSLYADITTGYGPECFSIPKPSAYPYELQAHYYSRGPMGFGMGLLQIIEHDGKGGLVIEDRPFVVMTDGAFVPLGVVGR